MSYQIIAYELVLTTNPDPNFYTLNHRFTLQNNSSSNLAGGQEARPGITIGLREGTVPLESNNFNIDPIAIGSTEQRYVTADQFTNSQSGRILKSDIDRVDNITFFVFDPSTNSYREGNGTSTFEVDDGSPKVQNGYKGWAILEEYDILSGSPTGQTKPNLPGDPDYVHPIYDPDSCPIGS